MALQCEVNTEGVIRFSEHRWDLSPLEQFLQCHGCVVRERIARRVDPTTERMQIPSVVKFRTLNQFWSRSGVMVRLFAFPQGEQGSIPGEVAPGFSHVVYHAGQCRWLAGFLGDTPFPLSFIMALLHTHLTSPSSALKIMMLRGAQISPPHSIHFTLSLVNRVRFPAGLLPDFRTWETCRTMPLVGEFSRGSAVSPPPHFGAALHSPHFTLISSQDLDVTSRPNLSTSSITH
ncbi:hypothetical protein PR048_014538 [Dryococelus australis]|uniref:Uncharacterized protein n=1 Tax=Dryococelus australis TaxID=614101 RepID=A0ABQ9HEN9_9NEOP|nr:hypothetical protein PR048_014538 [Dryococelus australis]